MKNRSDTDRASITVNTAAMLIHLAYRILGASKEHAWKQAKLHTVNAVMDKAIEKGGIIDPRHKGEAGIQAYFTEGGPLDGCSRFIDECRIATLEQDAPEDGDTRLHHYLRTDGKRGQQTVFRYLGLQTPDSIDILRKPQQVT
jgi:hypothetical protein